MELKKRIVQKNSLNENSIVVTFSYKEKESLKTKILDSSYNNKSLKDLLDIEKREKPKDNKKCSSYKLSFTGDAIEKEPLMKLGDINPKFAKMIRKWFYFFSKGNEFMDKDNVINFLSFMNQRNDITEFSDEYVQFMNDNEEIILEENFVEYYNNLAKSEPDKVWDNIKLMKYGKDFEKIGENDQNVDGSYLPRYILGNDQNFLDALSKLYMKFEKKLPIVEFVFFLCTNENKYNELLENFDVLFNNQNNNNHLELLYNLIIVESFVQDIEAIQLDLKEIFKENIKKDCVFNADNICQIASKKYMPFDDDNNLDKKKCFILNFIEKGGFEKIIKCIENILDSIENNNKDIEKMKYKCCQRGICIINTIYNSFTEKDKYEENNNTVDIYYLNNNIFKNILHIFNIYL
jgi:hypothetical protein